MIWAEHQAFGVRISDRSYCTMSDDVAVRLSLADLEALALELTAENRWRKGQRTKLVHALEKGSGIAGLLEQALRKQQGAGDVLSSVNDKSIAEAVAHQPQGEIN